MRVKRVVAGLTAVITAVLGLSLATASPAAAVDYGTWRAYGNTNLITSSASTWRCGTTYAVTTNVGAQVCAIRTADGSAAQAAVIVRNNRSSLYQAQGYITLEDTFFVYDGYLDERICPGHNVAANSWSVCFGRTIATTRAVKARGEVWNTSLGASPWAYPW